MQFVHTSHISFHIIHVIQWWGEKAMNEMPIKEDKGWSRTFILLLCRCLCFDVITWSPIDDKVIHTYHIIIIKYFSYATQLERDTCTLGTRQLDMLEGRSFFFTEDITIQLFHENSLEGKGEVTSCQVYEIISCEFW